MNEQEQFKKLFTDILVKADIKYAQEGTGDAYVAYNDLGILFSVTFYKYTKKYVFGCTDLFRQEYHKYGLPLTAIPDSRTVYETMVFAYKTRETAKKTKQDSDFIYNDTLIDSDIIFQMRGDFETYVVMNSGFFGYAIGYNKKTHQYGFKRYQLINILYKSCNIPMDNKPDYAKLYKRTKDYYMAQMALDSLKNFEIY